MWLICFGIPNTMYKEGIRGISPQDTAVPLGVNVVPVL